MRENRELVWTYGGENGSPAGRLYSDGIYETTRDTQEHFFRKFRGYAISLWILDDLKKRGCVYVDVLEKGVGGERTLRSELDRWFSFTASNYVWENGPQKVLPVNAMEDTRTRKLWKPGRIQETLA